MCLAVEPHELHLTPPELQGEIELFGLLDRCLLITVAVKDHVYMLLSVAGHLRVSQVVDPWMTARMTIDKAFLPDLIARA